MQQFHWRVSHSLPPVCLCKSFLTFFSKEESSSLFARSYKPHSQCTGNSEDGGRSSSTWRLSLNLHLQPGSSISLSTVPGFPWPLWLNFLTQKAYLLGAREEGRALAGKYGGGPWGSGAFITQTPSLFSALPLTTIFQEPITSHSKFYLYF